MSADAPTPDTSDAAAAAAPPQLDLTPAPDAAPDAPASDAKTLDLGAPDASQAADSPTDVPPESDTQQDAPKDAGDTSPSYEPFTLPDGIEAKAEDLEIFGEIGRELGLDQGGAQKLVDLHVEVHQAAVQAEHEALEGYAQAEQQSWQEALHADKELGGDNLEQTQKQVNAFANSPLGTEGLLELITSKGLVHHPEMVRLMSVIGGVLTEDSLSVSGNGAGELSEGDRARKMFGNSTPN